MQKVLVSLTDNLAVRMRAVIPNRQRSKVISEILEREVQKREKQLYQCAKNIETDDALNNEMSDWDIAVGDGIEIE